MSVPANRASASAPASIGNVGPGFDIIGQAFDAVRDTVVAIREEEPGVRLGRVTGLVASLPGTPAANTALAAAKVVLDAAGTRSGIRFGVRLDIDKGVPMSAGMGGSAASAVAAACAVNALIGEPYALRDLLPFALEGERVACDPPHWDNVMASLFGGLVLAARTDPPFVQVLPAPAGVVTVILHPAVHVRTSAARAMLAREVPLAQVVEHSRRVAAFVAGCVGDDRALIRAGLDDILIEPQRRRLLPAFPAVKAAALAAGALGCSFAGSGPSMFAWAAAEDADAVERAMAGAFADAGTAARAYCAPVASAGARVERLAVAA